MPNDGGPAFPQTYRMGGCSTQVDACGMTLRDYFAAKALVGYLAMYAGPDLQCPDPQDSATRAYDYADAMLAARKVGAA